MTEPPGVSARAGEIEVRLQAVRDRVHAACLAAGRDPGTVELLAVTKNFPASDVAYLADLGCRAFGEARQQEAAPKVAEVAVLRPGVAVRWHAVGRLQRNKARAVAQWVHRVESVDSDRLLTALDTAAGGAARAHPLEILLQVSVDGDPGRGGCRPEALGGLASRAADAEHLRLRGVMAVAPKGADPDVAFAAVHGLWLEVRAQYPDADQLSMGMSGDLEAAVRHGATCVRVGTALLGGRPIAST